MRQGKFDYGYNLHEGCLSVLYESFVVDAEFQFPLHRTAIENWNDQHGHDFDRHAAEAGDGHRHHDVAAAAGGGQDGDQREQCGCRGHQTWANASHTGGHGGFASVLGILDVVLAEAFVEVGRDYDAVVAGDAEQSQETDPDGDAEVDRFDLEQLSHVRAKQTEVEEPLGAVQPQHDEAARPRNQNAAEHQRCRDGGFELHVQDQEDDPECER